MKVNTPIEIDKPIIRNILARDLVLIEIVNLGYKKKHCYIVVMYVHELCYNLFSV